MKTSTTIPSGFVAHTPKTPGKRNPVRSEQQQIVDETQGFSSSPTLTPNPPNPLPKGEGTVAMAFETRS